MDRHGYQALLAQARRVSRNVDDAHDLVQDTLLVALDQGREDPAWLAGVLRRQAALRIRGEVRRRRREHAVAVADSVPPAADDNEASGPPSELIQRLPPAARRVAVLALHGLGAEEIRWILRISPTAFRQRLTGIRRALGALPPAQRAHAVALARLRDPQRSVDLQFGLVRRALKAALRGQAMGTHDPDGHLLVVRGAHTASAGGN
ncbi:sigma factor [Xanthomonas sp. XNM01]|uniref:RNA polymerase sigma factor n=1 Tax=Xanthomonas sp. XNM01 TaxID=2769289 RepID=UPI0017824146|nr:sigma factor [Xanthomonas sp. XNM01]MBD9367273.1 hypothetical protein [Xanthomonas sp. XNM01]